MPELNDLIENAIYSGPKCRRAHFSVNVSGDRSREDIPGIESASCLDDAGKDTVLVLSSGLAQDPTHSPVLTKLSFNVPIEFLRINEPRREFSVMSGGKYPIDDCRREVFVSAVALELEVGEKHVGAVIIEYLFGCRKLDGGVGDVSTSFGGVESAEFVTRRRGRGLWVVMVVEVTLRFGNHRISKSVLASKLP